MIGFGVGTPPESRSLVRVELFHLWFVSLDESAMGIICVQAVPPVKFFFKKVLTKLFFYDIIIIENKERGN